MSSLALRVQVVLLLPALTIPAMLLAGPGEPGTSSAVAGAANAIDAQPKKREVVEGFPPRIQARMELRIRSLKSVPPMHGLAPRFIINLSKRWQPRQTLKVAFRGGDTALHKQIADTVNEWTKYANLTFDFGINPSTGEYRSWKTTDTAFAAEIRVSFDQSGFYSLVANDSINTSISKPGEESLNLEGFDQSLPSDWSGVALHEFGHAIGFEHEHQGPGAPCDFRFDDDPGYVQTTDSFGQLIPDSSGKKPGLYTVLGGPPNNWPQAVVDFNLKQLTADSHAYEIGPFDKDSIMKYFFPDWMFASGNMSPCYTGAENVVLSPGDKEGAAKVYPKAPEQIKAASELRTTVLRDLTKVKTLPAATLQHLQHELSKYEDK